MGVLAEMANGGVIFHDVNFTTDVGTAPTLEFNPLTGDAALFSSSFQFGLPSLNQALGIYFECGYLLKMFTPGSGSITDAEALVSSGSTLSLMTSGQSVSSASAFNGASDINSYMNFSFPTDQDLYAGYRFMQSGESDFNYGYCTFSIHEVSFQSQITLKNVAYETTPGSSIEVGAIPEPATAGLLLFAALGVWLSRRLLRWNRPGE